MTSTALHRPGTSPVHRLPAQVKVVAAFTAVLAVVATPREAFWVFGADLAVLVGVWAVAGVPVGWFARRALIEVPFVLLAVVLPFTGSGPRTELLGLSVSVDGALAGWNILAKGTLGVLVSLTLAATTHPHDIVVGMQRLRMPQVVTTIASLMLRYIDVIVAEARRMHTARVCRGHDPRFLWQVGAVARGIGVLFLRSYERGERVHLAMLARGWTGAMPAPTATPAGTAGWFTGLSPALLVAVLAGVGLWTT
ncbi:cobalt ECF transporter T component CbiQ [Saccharomonospora amisosensis]|uniref:cobalt ECF transporter T component CbiQ n=1 Tax=Saccharomonospora amisosensis TaxID=1128677 RepID=UPI00142446BF|nr:cobalt ECF transporter T component CbiQ [Saccharomonospora amisosensis]